MANITTLDAPARGVTIYSPNEMSLIRHTIANDCNVAEFDLFMAAVRNYGLDPFRRQIFPLVFSKKSKEKRRMVICIGIDGQRVLAARCGDYRPASKPPKYVIREDLKGATNPHGIEKVTVYLHKQDNQGNWYDVMGEAYWDEFAPIKRGWSETERVDSGEKWPDGNTKYIQRPLPGAVEIETLDDSGQWHKMGRLMVAKCATNQALRAGWPDTYGGAYGEDEVERSRVADLTATQMVELAELEARQKMAGIRANTITMSFNPQDQLEEVPVGQMYDRVMAWVRTCEGPVDLIAFEARNKTQLKEFWSRSKDEALELRKELEAALVRLKSAGTAIDAAAA